MCSVCFTEEVLVLCIRYKEPKEYGLHVRYMPSKDVDWSECYFVITEGFSSPILDTEPSRPKNVEAVVLNPAEQELGKLGGSCGDVFEKIDTWRECTRVIMSMAEGQGISPKDSANSKEA